MKYILGKKIKYNFSAFEQIINSLAAINFPVFKMMTKNAPKKTEKYK